MRDSTWGATWAIPEGYLKTSNGGGLKMSKQWMHGRIRKETAGDCREKTHQVSFLI